MKFSQEGEWTVSTPVYAGTSEEISKAAKCPHRFVKVSETEADGLLMVLERCTACVAVRTRAKRLAE